MEYRTLSVPAWKNGTFHNLFQGKTDSFLGHEAAVQVSVSSSLCGNKKLVHLKLDNQDLNLNESKYKFRKATYEDDDSLLLLTLQLKKNNYYTKGYFAYMCKAMFNYILLICHYCKWTIFGQYL